MSKVKMPKKKTYLELLTQTKSRTPMGRPTVLLTEKDKKNKRCNRKQETRKEIRGYYD